MIALEHYLVVGAYSFLSGNSGRCHPPQCNQHSDGGGAHIECRQPESCRVRAVYRFREWRGRYSAVFVIVLAAAEAAVALAIVLNIYRNYQMVNIDRLDSLSG